MNEWGFAAEIKQWWEQAIKETPEWGLRAVRVEETAEGSKDRSDLTVHGVVPLMCGELRLPDHRIPSPWHIDSISDAITKAQRLGARWAFTSDGTKLVLFDTEKTGPLQSRVAFETELSSFQRRSQLDSPLTLARVKDAWIEALHGLVPIITGKTRPPGLAPDEVFVSALRALLQPVVTALRDALDASRRADPVLASSLVAWMVDGLNLVHIPADWEEELLQASRLTTYVFATRLIFYEALRQAKPKLSRITIVDTTDPEIAKAALEMMFRRATELSGDYETIFGWDDVSRYALHSPHVIGMWRKVCDHIARSEVSTLGHDVLGRLFERMIDPQERYEWGQHYTSSDVVDIMLSFAIPDGRGRLLDPACGGGTFLVRAYERKRSMITDERHQDRLEQLLGADVSHFACSIATINLAMRNLDFVDNYPRVAPTSFFRIEPGSSVINVPAPGSTSLGKRGTIPIDFSDVDALVANPPYVRIRLLGVERRREVDAILGKHGRVPTPSRVNGNANLHLYFWLHGARFIKPGGRLAFLTSGEWMDSDYGVGLQRWLLAHFKIEAFIESGVEPWFSEARVGTVVTIATECHDYDERMANPVRFVFLRKRLRELYGEAASGHPGLEAAAHFAAVDALRDRIKALGDQGTSSDMDWNTVLQEDLVRLGERQVAGGNDGGTTVAPNLQEVFV